MRLACHLAIRGLFFLNRGASMKTFYRLICHLLIASLIVLPQSVNAGMIGTDEATAGAQDSANRAKLGALFARERVAVRLQALGISPAMAQERVRAMTQEEVNQLASNIDSLPAAGLSEWVVLAVVLFIAGILYSMYGPDTKWGANRPL
jgi:uncharacterized protein DUF6627